MDNNLENVKNEIVDGAATKATEKAVEAAQGAVDAVKSELVDAITKSADAQTEANQIFQKQLDEIKKQAPAVIKSTGSGSELQQLLAEKKDDIARLKSDRGGSVVLDLKTFSASAGAASAPYSDQRVSEIKYDPNFMNRLRNFIPMGNTGQDGAIRHNFESAETDSTAPKSKGAVQTQSAVTVTDVHTPIQTIWNALTLPKEHLDDINMIESYLSTRLMGNLMDVEDVQILRGSGTAPNYSGINTNTRAFANAGAITSYVGSGISADFSTATNPANLYDVLAAAKAGMENTNFRPSLVILNPLDYTRIALIKASTREYVLSQAINAGSGQLETFFMGMRVLSTPAQTAGTFTLVDPQAIQYWQREGASVEFGYNGDDFKDNNITVRAGLRGALTTYKQNGIVSDAFSDWTTALNA